MHRLLLVFTLLFTLAVSAQEDDETERVRDYLEAEHRLAMDFETPHTKWAKPYAGGPTRVLFFSSWAQGSTDQREAIELMQRFDLEAQAVYFWSGRFVGDGRPDWFGGDGEAGTKRAQRLVGEGQQVFFLNKLAWTALPEWLQQDLRTHVEAGAGLVLVGDPAEIPGVRPVDGPPGTPGKFYACGKGRVALLPTREKLEFALGWETQLDYQLQAQGAALLWAAGKAPAVHLTLEAGDVHRSALPGATVRVTAAGALPEEAQLELELRRWDGVRTSLDTTPASGEATVPLPLLCAGRYHLNAIVRGAKGIEAWATRAFTVTSDRQVDDVVLHQDFAEVGEEVTGYVAVPTPLRRGDRVEVRLVDKDNRILAQQTTRVRQNKADFAFTIESWMPMLLRVEGVIVDNGEEVTSDYAYLRVTHRNRDQFNFMVWNFPGGDLAPYGVESMVDRGATLFLQQGPPPLFLAEHSAAYVPYATSFRVNSHTLTGMLDAETGYLKSGCIHDEAAMQAAVKTAVDGAQEARKLGVFAYSLGDENAVRASCLSPHCLQAYRAYLSEQYQDIAALNLSWGTDYGNFDEITLLTEGELPSEDAPEWFQEHFAERTQLHATDSEGAKGDEALARQLAFGNLNDEMRALQAGNFARWYDRQAFQSRNYIEWCKRYQAAFKKLDPHAWTGFEGTDSFSLRKLTTRSRQGGDLDGFAREMDYYGSYVGPGNEVLRSITPPTYPRGSWMGYTPDTEKMLREYWEQVTDGMNTVQWWRWDNLDGYHGFIAPTFASFAETQELFDDTKIVREWLGTLLMHCEMQDDGIAMLYSMPSTHIAHFDGNETYGKYRRDHETWHQHLHNAGLQFRYVTDRMLRLGEFDAKRYRVLILPLAFAIGEKEAEVIRGFVREGGTIIADVRPGLYDGHCKPLHQGSLDDLFGIRRTGNRPARDIDRLHMTEQLNGRDLPMKWGNWHGKDIYPQMKIDPSVEVTTGKPHGQAFQEHYWAGLNAPVCIVNDYGKGRAILLNFSVFDAPIGKLVPALLAAAGVERAIGVTTVEGAPINNVETSRWKNGGIELLSFLGDYTGEAIVQLQAAREVYDLRTQQHLGIVQTFSTTLRSNRAAFFALLPEQAELLQMSLPRQTHRGQTARATLHVERPQGQYPVVVVLSDPFGREAAWSRKLQVLGNAAVSVDLPFAHNDPAGMWSVSATNLITGQHVADTIQLR